LGSTRPDDNDPDPAPAAAAWPVRWAPSFHVWMRWCAGEWLVWRVKGEKEIGCRSSMTYSATYGKTRPMREARKFFCRFFFYRSTAHTQKKWPAGDKRGWKCPRMDGIGLKRADSLLKPPSLCWPSSLSLSPLLLLSTSFKFVVCVQHNTRGQACDSCCCLCWWQWVPRPKQEHNSTHSILRLTHSHPSPPSSPPERLHHDDVLAALHQG